MNPGGSRPPPLKAALLGLTVVPEPGIGFGVALADGPSQSCRVATLASSAHPVLAFPPSEDSPAVMAAPGQGPDLRVGGSCLQAGGHWDQAVSQRPPIWPSPQSARLSTVRPASATTSAPSVRRACTCTRAAAIRPVQRARRPPTAPWSAAVLVSLQGGPVGPEGWAPGEEQGEPTYLPTHPSPHRPGVPGLFCPLDPTCLQPQAQAERAGGRGSPGAFWSTQG